MRMPCALITPHPPIIKTSHITTPTKLRKLVRPKPDHPDHFPMALYCWSLCPQPSLQAFQTTNNSQLCVIYTHLKCNCFIYSMKLENIFSKPPGVATLFSYHQVSQGNSRLLAVHYIHFILHSIQSANFPSYCNFL